MHRAARWSVEPSVRFSVLDFRRSGRRWRLEFVQRPLQQVDEARELSLPRFYSSKLLLLGSVALTLGGVHGVVGVSDVTVGLVLEAIGIVNVAYDVRYSPAQFVERSVVLSRR
jgi:hypothetical protein